MRLRTLGLVAAGLSLFPSAAARPTLTITMFRDVPASHWAYDAITWVVDAKVMKAVSSTTFKPESPATRAEVAYASQQVYLSLTKRIEVLEAKAGIKPAPVPAVLPTQPEYLKVQARNAQRTADVSTIANALYQYSLDNNHLPTGITSSEKEICTTSSLLCTGLLKLDVLRGAYLDAIPRDPQETDPNHTGYSVTKDAQGRLTVKALHPEGDSIRITR